MWEKIKAGMGKMGQSMQRFFAGRYGVDQLSRTMLWAGLILSILDMFLGTGILSLVGMATYVVMLYRMLSKDMERRAGENRRYLAATHRLRTQFTQAKARFANRKEYKYVRCPNCRSWIRLPRGAGAVTVHCKPCGHAFEQKA